MQERAFTQTKLIAHARLKNDRVDANRLAYLLPIYYPRFPAMGCMILRRLGGRMAFKPSALEGEMPVIETKSSLDAVVKQYAFPDIHIGPGEDESPYVPYRENVYIRHLAFDVRNNMYANILWVKKGGMLGRHRHRGKVFACTLEGSWRYLEYDWVARAGSYVQESPGAIHTLVSDDPNGMKTIFWLNGSIDFFDDNDNLLETLDVFWFIDHYLSYCREHGIKINDKLFV